MNLSIISNFPSRTFRRIKYTVGAVTIDWFVKNTTLFDGDGKPPDWINFAGAGSFRDIGDLIVDRMCQVAGLRDGQKVLEIGCGIGRNATAIFRRKIDVDYEGFDVVAYGISWCRKFFSGSRKFRFIHAGIYNSFYNPLGKIRATEYAFEYGDGAFDLVFATSVFTHMPRKQVMRYLVEASRCMKPGARAFFTFFILDEEVRQLISDGKSRFSFKFPQYETWVEREYEPDVAVAFDRDDLLGMLRDAGFVVSASYPGAWRGDNTNIDFQDVLVLVKE